MSQLRPTMAAQNSKSSSGHSSIGSTNSKKQLIRHLPPAVRQELCAHLDEENAWIELAKLMNLTEGEMRTIRQKQYLNQSPADEMLKIWGNIYGHETDELFYLLYKRELFAAMHLIKKFVTYNLHVLLPAKPISRPAISDLLAAAATASEQAESEKILNCSSLTTDSLETRDDNYTTSCDSYTSNQSPGQKQQRLQQQNTQSTLLSERSVKEYASSNLEINYDELSEATENWHERNILGKGGFGTVYKGYWKHTDVAIKQIHYRAPNGCENIKVQIQQSLNELKYLNSFRHDNVLPLYGYSIRGEKPCLVYQFMRGGCLDKRLHTKHNNDSPPLTLKQRIDISLGVARGLNYIHTHTPDKPLIHGDIKPANVLLDQCLMPKIGDFGLAREGPNGVKIAVEVQQVFGTKCYLPPEFLNSKKLSTQVDTYSFGVTLLETFTGQRAFSKNRAVQLLTDYVAIFFSNSERKLPELLDPNITVNTAAEMEIISAIFFLGLQCTAFSPQQRPAMEDVLKALSRFCL